MTSIFKTARQARRFLLESLLDVPRASLIATTLLGGFTAPICGASGGFERADTVSTEYHQPIPVELVSYLDVHHFHTGSSFFVKVAHDWSGLGCFFRNGQILEGKVLKASLRSRRSTPSQLAIAFEKIPCLYNAVTIDLVLAAVSFDASANIPNSTFPIMHSSKELTGSVKTIQRSFVVEGLEMAAMSGKQGNRPPLKPGDVVGMKGVTLHMGAGPGRSSVLESSTRDVWLEKEAVLVLVPASVAFMHPPSPDVEVNLSPKDTPATEPGEARTAETAALNAPAAALASSTPEREFLPCEPPTCNVDLPAEGSGHSGSALQSIAIGSLGYAPRPQRELAELDNDDALVWLGPQQLMAAFNPHKLIAREGTTSATTVRRIRAIVLDLSSQRVVSTADWDLSDRQPYLWQLSNNRVLVHVGGELRVLSEDLQVKTRIPLDGPLAFVRTSPNGELTAIAVTQERHSPELHLKLREALGHDPDEDVQIRILDKDSKIVAQATSSREIMPPILLNEGQVRLLAARDMKYRLELLPWQGDT